MDAEMTVRQATQAGGMAVSPQQWNVLTAPWLEVMDLGARHQTVSVLDALRTASDLHQIVSPNALDLFAAHRFLLTLLYWQSPSCDGVEKLRKALLAGRMPRAVIQGLKEEVDRFNLFDPKKPFLQDPSATGAKTLPASSLFAEMASGTNVAHFHHGDDDTSRLCIRCATLGLLRLVPWTQSGGAGKQPSVHGAPPIQPLALGETLCETLGLNLVEPAVALGRPQWSGQFRPLAKRGGVQLLEGLTWNPRRVHLLEPQGPAQCCQCGETRMATVGPIIYEKNPACKVADDDAGEWRDPSAFYRAGDSRTVKTGRESDAASADDLRRLFEQTFGKKTEPAPVSQVVQDNPTHRDWLVIMPCTNPANNKSYDHRLERLAGFACAAPPRSKHWSDHLPWQADDKRRLAAFETNRPNKGMYRFVAAAAQLDHASWGVLANAAGRGLDEDPAAFDIFTGIYWPLRNKDYSLPSRAAAWTSLKLMAAGGLARPCPGRISGAFRPWADLNTAASPAKKKVYRRSVPGALRLEAELRDIIRRAVLRSPTIRIDWPGLCQFLTDSIA